MYWIFFVAVWMAGFWLGYAFSAWLENFRAEVFEGIPEDEQ